VDSTLAAAAAVDLPAAEGTSDEVTPEDIEKMQHAMAIAASKRARYTIYMGLINSCLAGHVGQ